MGEVALSVTAMMTRVLVSFLVLLMLGGARLKAQSLPFETVFKGKSRFDALVEKVKPKVAQLRTLPIGKRVAWFGLVFVGTPYKSYTLEIHDRIEAASANLLGLDCWTFFEVSLAFARMVDEPEENWTPQTFLRYIEMDRYWGGKCTGSYLSRLHYLEDWLHDNAKRGLVQNLTRTLGGRGVENSATEMTNNWKSYRYMAANPDLRSGIAKLEARLRRQSLVMIPKDKVAGIESQLQDGDIIGIVSKDGDAFGTSHVGLAIRKNGVVHFMHASSPRNAGKVVVDSRLSAYLDKFSKHAGILVARPAK
jgi:hypothetical protein